MEMPANFVEDFFLVGHDPSLIEGSVSFQFSLEVFGQLSVELHFWCTLLMFLYTLGSFFLFTFLWFLKKIFFSLFIFGCVGFSLLRVG